MSERYFLTIRPMLDVFDSRFIELAPVVYVVDADLIGVKPSNFPRTIRSTVGYGRLTLPSDGAFSECRIAFDVSASNQATPRPTPLLEIESKES